MRRLVESQRLHTVCEEARCPNIYECWGEHGTATFMILGDVCTRRCGFCAVTTGRPAAGVDADEPAAWPRRCATMGLRHAVITSVDRDDLADGGAQHFAEVIAAVRELNPATAVEVLTPDFRGVPTRSTSCSRRGPRCSRTTWRRCRGSTATRAPAASSTAASRCSPAPPTRRDRGEYRGRVKTGLMLGLGEDDDEMRRRSRASATPASRSSPSASTCSRPASTCRSTAGCIPTSSPRCASFALELGFAHCEAGPLVRSSYHAHEHVRAVLGAEGISGGGRGTHHVRSRRAVRGAKMMTSERMVNTMRFSKCSAD